MDQFGADMFLLQGTNLISHCDDNCMQGNYYEFTNVPAGVYQVHACKYITSPFPPNETKLYAGTRTNISPPNPYVDMFMVDNWPGGCMFEKFNKIKPEEISLVV